MKNRRSALLRACSLIVAATVISGCAVANVTEQSLLHPSPGPALVSADIAAVAPDYALEQHYVVTPDGIRLSAVLLRFPGARQTVLYFGGNAYQSGRQGAATAAIFARLGVNVMILDKRGYGHSEGLPTAQNIQTDGTAAFDYLAGLNGIDPASIVLHGQSVGSIVAGYVAASRPSAGVVLESAVTTTEDWVANQTRSRPLARVRLADSLKGVGVSPSIGAIGEPILLLVGADDATTPSEFSRALYEAAPATTDKRLVVVPDAGHNNTLRQPEAIAAYQEFLRDLRDDVRPRSS